jgi:hypothetical protein
MILTKIIQVRPNSKTLHYYKKLGYDCKMYSVLEIPVEHLTGGSHQILDVKCDVCGKERKLVYNTYWRNTKELTEIYACCEKCGMTKRDKTNLDLYGVKNVFQNEEIKTKIKDSYLINLGVDHPSKNIDIQTNTKNTNLERYGFICSMLNENIKRKVENSCLEKYGVKNPFQSKKSYSTKKENILKKYKNIGLVDIINDEHKMVCNKGHNFILNSCIFYNRLQTTLCTICNPVGDYHRSGLESKLSDFIIENYKDVIQLNKKFSYQEIDVYLPKLKLAFEFNGVYWHNELNKINNYHLNKTEFCEKQDIHLIHIYEDDWIYKQEIVKSRILNLLGKTLERIYGRKCIIKEITDNDLIRSFLEENHIQGFVGSQIKLGLFYNEDLVSLMTFGKQRKSMGTKSSENVYEMLRFCNKLNTSVIGAADKLFKYFIKNYNPIEVISYADRSWSQGDLYYKLGFKLVHKTSPNYYYVIGQKRNHRFNYRKDKLIREGYDPTKSEHDIMLERKIYRIYDSGSLKFSYLHQSK